MSVEQVQHILSVFSFLGHLSLASAILLRVGIAGRSPTWALLGDVWSDYGIPIAFIIISVLALIGYRTIWYLRLSLYIGAGVMILWAGTLMVGWFVGFGPAWNLFWIAWLGMLKWCMAEYGLNYVRLVQTLKTIVVETPDPTPTGMRADEQCG